MLFIECTAPDVGKCLINAAQILAIYERNDGTVIIVHADGRGTEISEKYEEVKKRLKEAGYVKTQENHERQCDYNLKRCTC